MSMEQKKNFLINTVYWLVIAVLGFLFIDYLLPIIMPFVFGMLVAFAVIWLSRKMKCSNKWLRLLIAVVIYAGIGGLVAFVTFRGIRFLTGLVKWLPELYQLKLQPAGEEIYLWFSGLLQNLDPEVGRLLSVVSSSIMSGLEKLLSAVSKGAVSLISNAATGVPRTILATLAMIFSTVFVVMDYDRIREFTHSHVTPKWIDFTYSIRDYLTNTLFVVIRSYLLIMLLTFTELSLLFWIFGIENAVVKAAVIAVLDILPLLGTGGIMIPWAVVSFIIGHTALGFKLLAIYAIVTVIRNYVEPRIVGAQLGLHPIITLVSMFIGLRMVGFWGIFGFPVVISFFWKRHQEKRRRASEEAARSAGDITDPSSEETPPQP